jgi:hypothetical protein
MSFKCGVTGKTVANERMNKIVTEKRDKVYTDQEGNEIGKGWEIAKEIPVSVEGMQRLQRAEENERRLDQAAE